MFCPVCRSEYVEGITRCSDCNAELVSELPAEEKQRPPEPPAFQGKMVMIYRAGSAQEIALIKMVLEREGIPYAVANENRIYLPIASEFEIWVAEEEAERAVEVLKEGLELK